MTPWSLVKLYIFQVNILPPPPKLLASCLAWSSALKMDAVYYSETSANLHATIQLVTTQETVTFTITAIETINPTDITSSWNCKQGALLQSIPVLGSMTCRGHTVSTYWLPYCNITFYASSILGYYYRTVPLTYSLQAPHKHFTLSFRSALPSHTHGLPTDSDTSTPATNIIQIISYPVHHCHQMVTTWLSSS